jgi:hypothetical protein
VGTDPKIISMPYYSTGWSSPFVSWALVAGEIGGSDPNGGITVGGALHVLDSALNTGTGVAAEACQTYDGSNQKIYVNGVLKATDALTGNIGYGGAGTFCLGTRSSYSPSEYLNGDIAEVLVYNRALSDSERLSIEAYLMAKYNITPATLDAPLINISSGALTAPSQIVLNAPAGATIYYTTDGSTPTTSSQIYSGPIYVDYSQTINAIAYQNGLITSSVTTASYTLNPTLYPAPTPGGHTSPTITLQLPTNATLIP